MLLTPEQQEKLARLFRRLDEGDNGQDAQTALAVYAGEVHQKIGYEIVAAPPQLPTLPTSDEVIRAAGWRLHRQAERLGVVHERPDIELTLDFGELDPIRVGTAALTPRTAQPVRERNERGTLSGVVGMVVNDTLQELGLLVTDVQRVAKGAEVKKNESDVSVVFGRQSLRQRGQETRCGDQRMR